MNSDKKVNQFYILMVFVCTMAAVLVFASAKEETWGGIPLQQMIGWILIVTAISFFSKLNLLKGK
jgi:hypothetical protein